MTFYFVEFKGSFSSNKQHSKINVECNRLILHFLKFIGLKDGRKINKFVEFEILHGGLLKIFQTDHFFYTDQQAYIK